MCMYKLAGLAVLQAMNRPDHGRNSSGRDCDLRPHAGIDNQTGFKLRRKVRPDLHRDRHLVGATGSAGPSGTAPRLGCKVSLLKVAFTNLAFTPLSALGGLLRSSGHSGGTPSCAHTEHWLQSES